MKFVLWAAFWVQTFRGDVFCEDHERFEKRLVCNKSTARNALRNMVMRLRRKYPAWVLVASGFTTQWRYMKICRRAFGPQWRDSCLFSDPDRSPRSVAKEREVVVALFPLKQALDSDRKFLEAQELCSREIRSIYGTKGPGPGQ